MTIHQLKKNGRNLKINFLTKMFRSNGVTWQNIVSLKVDKIANKFTIYIYCSGKLSNKLVSDTKQSNKININLLVFSFSSYLFINK